MSKKRNDTTKGTPMAKKNGVKIINGHDEPNMRYADSFGAAIPINTCDGNTLRLLGRIDNKDILLKIEVDSTYNDAPRRVRVTVNEVIKP